MLLFEFVEENPFSDCWLGGLNLLSLKSVVGGESTHALEFFSEKNEQSF